MPVVVEKEEIVEVVREVPKEVRVPRYVEVERRVFKEVEVVDEEVVEVEEHVTKEVERVIETDGGEEIVEIEIEVPIEEEVIVERKVDTPVEREVVREEKVLEERIEYIDKPVPREVVREVVLERKVPGKKVTRTVKVPFDVPREIVVQRVKEVEVIVETVSDLPRGWGVVLDEHGAKGVAYYNSFTEERTQERPGGPRPACKCCARGEGDLASLRPPDLREVPMSSAPDES